MWHLYRHAGENRHPEVLEIPRFWVAPAIANSSGMTTHFCFVNFQVTTLYSSLAARNDTKSK
jgi:hypothetical protein